MLLALAAFCFVASITPGPNNMMLLSSGATFGLRRTVPHIAGISGGFALMVLVLGWGLAGLVARIDGFHLAMQVAATAYLLWLAWRIAVSADHGNTDELRQPLGMFAAAAFQWVNPKAWAMVLGAISSFARPDAMAADVPLVAAVFAVVGLPCIVLWAACGMMLQRVLRRPGALRLFNRTMAAVLVLSLVPGWLDLVHAAPPMDLL